MCARFPLKLLLPAWLILQLVTPICAQSFGIFQVEGSAPLNANSPLGTNLAEIGPSSAEQPFLNLWKSMGSWQTANNSNPDTGDENALYTNCVDSNHYLNVSPATCATNFGTTFTFLRAFFLSFLQSSFNYPAGNYILLWDGNSNAVFQNAISGLFDPATFTSCPVSGHPNRIVVAANSPSIGLEIDLSSIGTGSSYPTNLRLVYSPNSTCGTIGTREALLNSGEIIDPNFKAKITWARAIRLMKWGGNGSLINNTETTWSARAQLNWVSWNETGFGGVPVAAVPWEVGVTLANEFGADLWISTPPLANQAYSQNLAALVHSLLNTTSWVYVERDNECWNTGSFSAAVASGLQTLGLATFPSSVDQLQWFCYYGLQAGIDDGISWKTSWGTDSARIVRVFGGLTGETGVNGFNQILLETTTPVLGGGSWTGAAKTHFDLLATAPYFGNPIPSAWTADVDGGLTKFFQQVNSGILPDGSGAVTTGGTSTAYTVAAGSGTVSNQEVIQVKFHTNNGANPTLTANDGGTYPIQNDDGTVPAVNAINNVNFPPCGCFVVVFTNATSAGAVTPSWRLLTGTGVGTAGLGRGPTQYDALGDLHEAITFASNNLADAVAEGLGLTYYEGTWAYNSYCSPATSTCVINNLYSAAALDTRSYTLIQSYFNQIKAGGGITSVFMQFTDIFAQGFAGESWGNYLSWQQSTTPRAQSELDWIAANPCSGCGHH